MAYIWQKFGMSLAKLKQPSGKHLAYAEINWHTSAEHDADFFQHGWKRRGVGLWAVQELQRLNSFPPASSPGAAVAKAGTASAVAHGAVASSVVVAAAGPSVGAADCIVAALRRLDAMGPPMATAALVDALVPSVAAGTGRAGTQQGC